MPDAALRPFVAGRLKAKPNRHLCKYTNLCYFVVRRLGHRGDKRGRSAALDAAKRGMKGLPACRPYPHPKLCR